MKYKKIRIIKFSKVAYKLRVKLCTILLFGLGLTGLQAQESVNATGANASDSGGTACYSIGQVAYSTNIGSGGSVTQGVQQPFEISVVMSIKEAKGINISVLAYPNPTANNLILRINEFEISNLSYQLFDMQGKLLLKEKMTSKQTNIVMSHFLPASYIVKIFQENKQVKTFKIIKN